MTINSTIFRQTLRAFPTGVTVITANAPDRSPIGITISSFASLSLEPFQVLFCLTKSAHCLPLFEKEYAFVVNILAAHQGHLADHFATPAPKRAPLDWSDIQSHIHPGVSIPLIKETLGYIVCKVAQVYDGGDHKIIVGKVVDLIRYEDVTEPLIRHLSSYKTTEPL